VISKARGGVGAAVGLEIAMRLSPYMLVGRATAKRVALGNGAIVREPRCRLLAGRSLCHLDAKICASQIAGRIEDPCTPRSD